jgi:putative transposase
MCNKCGWIKKDLKLSDREWKCESCQADHDRDLNAAMNIKLFGLRTQPFDGKVA